MKLIGQVGIGCMLLVLALLGGIACAVFVLSQI